MTPEIYADRVKAGFLQKCESPRNARVQGCGRHLEYGKFYVRETKLKDNTISFKVNKTCKDCRRVYDKARLAARAVKDREKRNAACKSAVIHTGPVGSWRTFLCEVPPTLSREFRELSDV